MRLTSLVLPQQVKIHSGGYLGHVVFFTLKSRLNHDMEEKGIVLPELRQSHGKLTRNIYLCMESPCFWNVQTSQPIARPLSSKFNKPPFSLYVSYLVIVGNGYVLQRTTWKAPKTHNYIHYLSSYLKETWCVTLSDTNL